LNHPADIPALAPQVSNPNFPVLYHLPSCEEAMGEAIARSADLLERVIVWTKPHRPAMGTKGRR
jgi:hypothetical protein